MSERDSLLDYLRKKAEELRRELDYIEELIRVLEACRENSIAGEPRIYRERSGVRMALPKPIDPGSVEAEYLTSRLRDVLGESFEIQYDHSGRIKGVRIRKPVDTRTIIEVKSIIKTVMGHSG